jgi:hypothetical protein
VIITLSSVGGLKCQLGELSLVVDPSPSAKLVEGKSLILFTKTDWPSTFIGSREIVLGPGEYEIGGIRIKGVKLAGETGEKFLRTAYLVNSDGLRLSFWGELRAGPTESELEQLGEIDVLFFSASAKKQDAKWLHSLVKQVDPPIVAPTDETTVRLLAEEMGQAPSATDKLVLKKKDFLAENLVTKLVWLKTK